MQQSATHTGRMNVRAMQAQGALCLAAYCAALDIRHAAVTELLSHLLDLLTSDDLPAWEQRGTLLNVGGRGDPVPEDVDALVPPELRHEFAVLVEFVVEIGIADMYVASSDDPRRFLQKSMEIVEARRIDVPDVSDQLPADRPDTASDDTWGEPMPPETSATIRKRCLDLFGG